MRLACFLLFAAASLAQIQGVPVKATVDAIGADPSLYWELITPEQDPTLKPNAKRIIVSAAPIWYADPATGNVSRITIDAQSALDPVDGEAALVETRNSIQYRLNENGVSTFRVGPYILRTRLAQVRIEDATSFTQRKQTASTRPTALVKDDGRRLRVEGFFPNVSYQTEIKPGAVKENIVLASVPDNAILNGEAVLTVFQWDVSRGATLTPEIENGDLVWKNNGGAVILRMVSPYVFDAKSSEIPSRYFLRGQFYAVAMPGRQMRDAAYPVTIDPTVTTAQDSSNNNVLATNFEDASDDQFNEVYFKFSNMPDLTGLYTSIDSATLQIDVSTVTGAGATSFDVFFKNLAAGGSPTEGWNESSVAATMNALSMGTATATAQTATTTGTKTYDILGDATKGVVKIYTDDPSPDACTAALYDNTSTGDPSDDQSAATIRIGEAEGTDSYATITNDNDATNYPRINITYTATGSSVVPGRKSTGAGIVQ